MAKIFMTEDDLGEAAQYLLDPADDTLDPLNILLSREEDAEEAFFSALADLLNARKATKRITFH